MINGPVEPNADMRVAAREVHEMYIALKEEGFTEREALTIIGHIIATGTNQ